VRAIRMFLLASVILASIGLAGTALAQTSEQPPEDEVKGEVIGGNQPGPQPGVLPSLQPRGEEVAPGVLPITGADLTIFVVVGIAAIALGTAIVRRSRARART
jgi:LPXTG-motif cell wall-anchored protein